MRPTCPVVTAVLCLTLFPGLASRAAAQELPPRPFSHANECGLMEGIVSKDAERAEAAILELKSRGPASLQQALRCAIFLAGPAPEDLFSVEFDPVRSALLDQALAGIARMGAPAVPELSRLVAAGGAEGALAAGTLGAIGPGAVAAAPKLLAATSAEHRLLRAGARNALPKLGPAAVPALLKGLTDTNADIREYAAEALGRLAVEPGRSVPALVAALRDAEYGVRSTAANALAAFGPAARAAVKPLLDPRPGEAADAVEASDFGDALARIVTDPAALRPALHSDDPRVSRRAASALGQMPPLGPQLLIEALASPRPVVRRAALEGLRPASAGVAAAEPLAKLLADPDPELRANALVFLANLGPPAAVVLPAVSAMLGAAEPRVRSAALQAMGSLATTPAQIAPAVPLLRDPVLEVRQAAAMALVSCPGGPETLPLLLDLLPQPDMAGPAARALGALALPGALEPLRRLLDGDQPSLRQAAARGLAGFGPRAAPAADGLLRALKADEAGRCEYWIVLVQIGPPAARKVAEARRLLGEEGVGVCEELRAGRSPTR